MLLLTLSNVIEDTGFVPAKDYWMREVSLRKLSQQETGASSFSIALGPSSLRVFVYYDTCHVLYDSVTRVGVETTVSGTHDNNCKFAVLL